MRGHPVPAQGFGGLAADAYEDIAGRLITARYGVIVFSPGDLDRLAMEALLNFAQTLNKTTRAALLPVGGRRGRADFCPGRRLDDGVTAAQRLYARRARLRSLALRRGAADRGGRMRRAHLAVVLRGERRRPGERSCR